MEREFVTKMLDETLNRHGRRIAQGANGTPHYISGDTVQQIEVVGTPQTIFNPMNNPIEPACTFTALCALPTGLFEIEIRQSLESLDHAGAFIHHDDCTGTKHGARLGDRVVIHGAIHHHRTRQDRSRRPTRDHRLQLATAADATGHLEQHGKRRTERNLVIAGFIHMTRY